MQKLAIACSVLALIGGAEMVLAQNYQDKLNKTPIGTAPYVPPRKEVPAQPVKPLYTPPKPYYTPVKVPVLKDQPKPTNVQQKNESNPYVNNAKQFQQSIQNKKGTQK